MYGISIDRPSGASKKKLAKKDRGDDGRPAGPTTAVKHRF